MRISLEHLRSACGAIIVALALSALATGARSEDATELLDTKPYLVKIHADWCHTCKVLEQTWLEVKTRLGERAHIVILNVSNRAAMERSMAEAERLGLSDFFREYRAETGTIGIIDGKNHKTIAIMRGETDFSKYEEAVAKASPSP